MSQTVSERGAQLDHKTQLRVALLHTVYYNYELIQRRNPYALVTGQESLMNEAWLLCHGYDPQDFSEDCATFLSNQLMMDLIRVSEDRDELTCFLLCTLKHLS